MRVPRVFLVKASKRSSLATLADRGRGCVYRLYIETDVLSVMPTPWPDEDDLVLPA